MSDLQQKIETATAKLMSSRQERDAAEQEWRSHEETAKEIRAESDKQRVDASNRALEHEKLARAAIARYEQAKKECAELTVALGHTQVLQRIDDSEVAQRRAQSLAEETLARLAEKEKTLDELLAKAKAEAEAKDKAGK